MSILFIVSDVKKGFEYCCEEFGVPDAHVIMRDRAFLRCDDKQDVEIRLHNSRLDSYRGNVNYDLIMIEDNICLTDSETCCVNLIAHINEGILKNKFYIAK